MERNYKQIDQLERDQLAIHRSKGLSFSAIGKLLGRSGSALSREYKRNLNHAGNYLPSEAEGNAKRRKKMGGGKQGLNVNFMKKISILAYVKAGHPNR